MSGHGTGERVRRAIRAFGLLTASTVRRLLREGMVLRSMVWPSVVVIGTLAATIAVLAAFRTARAVAIPENEPELAAWLEDGGFEVFEVGDPHAAVAEERYSVGTDGHTLWARGTSTTALDVEEVLRTQLGASWRPLAPRDLPSIEAGRRQGRIISRFVAALFVMYGTVFGLGSVARDRDDGSLEAELSLPIPRWVGGLARWTASSLVLAVFYALCVVVLAAVIGVADVGAQLRHGAAACAGGVAVGLAVVGTAGIKQGFSGPLAASLTGVVGLFAIGAIYDLPWLPIGSLLSESSGYATLGTALVMGLLSSALYGIRTGRA